MAPPDPPPPPPPGGVPTYYEDVAPILAENCIGCHSDGGIAPMQLTTYTQAVDWKDQMAAKTAAREMPPWHADNSGACNTYQGARWLAQTDIDTIAAWAAGGAPEGDPANAPPPPEPPPDLTGVNATVDTGTDYLPVDGPEDDYHCFIVDPQLTADGFVTAYHAVPGEPKVVHHIILFSLDTPEAEAQAVANDAATPEVGYHCAGGAMVDESGSRFLAGWVPGLPPTHFPATTGVPVSAGRKMVMQIHYNTQNGVLPDRTHIDLVIAPTVDKEAIITGVSGDHGFQIPPDTVDAEVDGQQAVPAPASVALTVWGIAPHMHTYGQTLHVESSSGGDPQCMVDVPAWNFHWQQMYFYDQPLTVHGGDMVSISCTYDTTDAPGMVTYGESTSNEMCLALLYVTR